MRLSQYFIPTLKETPADAQIASHRLMLRAGMINQTISGIYSWLPLGLRVLDKIQEIIHKQHEAGNCIKILMSTLQPAHLWQESGRYEDYGKEMLRIKDRHDRDLLYGPTNEEVVTDIFRQYVKSYKQVPLVLYQIQWKFRDEIRPRFGVMRGREFLMKDAYSFDLDRAGAQSTYKKMFEIYLKTFKALGLKAIPVRADSGAIGGDMSHEFQIIAPTGESQIYYDKAFDNLKDDELTFEHLNPLYAASDEKHNPDDCPVEAQNLGTARGIEVGHIFYFGTKYTQSMNTKIMNQDGKPTTPEMGSYGIGVSRLVGAIIEANHDENGIMWPQSVAPFHVGLINVKSKDEALTKIADTIYQDLLAKNVEVLYDDTDERAGAKFANMDLIGLPWQIIVGSKAVDGIVEIKNRRTNERFEKPISQIIEFLL